MTVMVSSLEVF